MKFTAYSPSTGQVLFRGEASDPAALESEDVSILLNQKHEEDGWIENGEFNPLPERPTNQHTFDYSIKAWVDSRNLSALKDEAYEKIQKWRNQQENSSFVFQHAGRNWDAGLVVRQRLQPVLGLSALPAGFFWTDADNNDVPITMPELIALSAAHEQALVLKGFEIHAQQRALKNAVLASTSIEEVKAIDIG